MEEEPLMYPDEAHNWSMLIHLSAFTLFPTIIGYILAPLILWLMKREESSIVDKQGKEVLNFQITCTFYLMAAIPISFALNMLILLYLLLIAWMVAVIQGAQAANEGRPFRYPLTLRLIR